MFSPLRHLETGFRLSLAISLLLLTVSSGASVEVRGEPVVKRVLLYDPGVQGKASGPRTHLRKALERLAEEKDFVVTMTRDPKVITYLDLQRFDAVIFAHGEGNVLASSQGQKDLERYVREGGGLLAVRSAASPGFPFLADALAAQYTPWSGGTVKARLHADPQALGKPELQGVFEGLPHEVFLKDRWLNFGDNPRKKSGVTVLFSVDESSYPHGRMNGDHPIVWSRAMDKGRFVYNALGHENVYTQQNGFGAALLWNLIEYAAHKDTSEPLAKAASLAAPAGVTLEGRGMILALNEGAYVLRISDFKGRGVFAKAFTGPGQFRVEPALVNGNYTLTLTGPSVRYKKPFTVR